MQKQQEVQQPAVFGGGLQGQEIKPVPIQNVELPQTPDVPSNQGTISITALNGACDVSLSDLLAGVTVAEVREAVRETLNIRADTEAYVNGKLVTEEYVLQDQEQIEFMKPSGQKGVF